MRRRLLHPGANTHQIIDVYIATIKVLRVLDPKVCEIIAEIFKKRARFTPFFLVEPEESVCEM